MKSCHTSSKILEIDLNNLPASQRFHQINWKTTHCLINRTECLPYFIVKFQVAQYCLLWHRSNASVFRPHLACFSKNLKKYSSSFGCCAAERGDLRTLRLCLHDLRSVNTYRAGSGLKYQDSVEFCCIFSPNVKKKLYLCSGVDVFVGKMANFMIKKQSHVCRTENTA